MLRDDDADARGEAETLVLPDSVAADSVACAEKDAEPERLDAFVADTRTVIETDRETELVAVPIASVVDCVDDTLPLAVAEAQRLVVPLPDGLRLSRGETVGECAALLVALLAFVGSAERLTLTVPHSRIVTDTDGVVDAEAVVVFDTSGVCDTRGERDGDVDADGDVEGRTLRDGDGETVPDTDSRLDAETETEFATRSEGEAARVSDDEADARRIVAVACCDTDALRDDDGEALGLLESDALPQLDDEVEGDEAAESDCERVATPETDGEPDGRAERVLAKETVGQVVGTSEAFAFAVAETVDVCEALTVSLSDGLPDVLPLELGEPLRLGVADGLPDTEMTDAVSVRLTVAVDDGAELPVPATTVREMLLVADGDRLGDGDADCEDVARALREPLRV